jgi:hypothetical protein
MGGTDLPRRVRVVRRVRWAATAAALGLLVADVLAFRSVVNRPRPVAMSTVIARYRDKVSPAAAAAPSVVASAPATPAPGTAVTAAVPGVRVTPMHTTTGTGAAVGTAAPIATLVAPASGVYVYNTSGHEETDAVGGAGHAYPAQTTITVTPSPCGYTMRWDAIEQRWDEWGACVSGRQVLVQSERMKHAFYGVNDTRQYACTGATFRPASDAAGTPVAGRCAGSGDNAAWSGQVAGHDTIMVAGAAVKTVHVVIEERVTGDTNGMRHSDNWFAEDSALLVRRVATVEGDSQTAAGKAHYTESVTLELTSLTPAQ